MGATLLDGMDESSLPVRIDFGALLPPTPVVRRLLVGAGIPLCRCKGIPFVDARRRVPEVFLPLLLIAGVEIGFDDLLVVVLVALNFAVAAACR
jgi:hypothetical protein